jgi:IMP dehydrogenase
MFEKALSYDDVLLQPQHSDIVTRADINLAVKLDDELKMRLPVFAAPMDTIMSPMMAATVFQAGGIGIFHRYCSIEDQVEMVQNSFTLMPFQVRPSTIVFAAVGVTGKYFERAERMIEAGCKGICVDVAHGHHRNVISAVEKLRDRFPKIHVMAGNVATRNGLEALADAGAHSIRVGVGGGSICSTRIQTGHGVPTFQSILECSNSDRDALIIADGGIKNSGDIVKALAAGADAVMVGRLLAGTNEAPGDVIHNPSASPVKVYRGMASPEAQQDWHGKHSSNEGVSRTVRLRGSAVAVLVDIDRGIRSGLSYSGARNIRELQAKARFVLQTSAGMIESSTHIDL